MFENVYKNKKVLVTGNTGFKGSWLSIWLTNLGAKVYGLSKDIPTEPSNFLACKLDEKIITHYVDIRDFKKTFDVIAEVQPDFIFHLAAQPLVRESYVDPKTTFETNIIGTMNVLESLRILNRSCVGIMITSDKCYNNIEWIWGYRENDELGGEDPYSASKGAAEFIIKSYANSYFKQSTSKTSILSTRAGNVIGGGDWAKDRIVPDAIRAWVENNELVIRNPKATRPWQHVLEPLSGYLLAGKELSKDRKLNGEPFNFGPSLGQNHSVEELLNEMKKLWNGAMWIKEIGSAEMKEAILLRLNCDKADTILNWKPNLNFIETVDMVMNWYNEYYTNKRIDMYDFTSNQINYFLSEAKEKKIVWTK